MTNEQLVHTWFDRVWNQQDETAIDQYLSSDGIANGLTDEDGNTMKGPESFKKLHRKFLSSFPDLKLKVLKTVSQDNVIAALVSVTGTHSGAPFEILPGKTVEAQQQPVTIDFTGTTITVIKDDMIAEAWNHFDFLTMFMQMGARIELAMEHA